MTVVKVVKYVYAEPMRAKKVYNAGGGWWVDDCIRSDKNSFAWLKLPRSDASLPVGFRHLVVWRRRRGRLVLRARRRTHTTVRRREVAALHVGSVEVGHKSASTHRAR